MYLPGIRLWGKEKKKSDIWCIGQSSRSVRHECTERYWNLKQQEDKINNCSTLHLFLRWAEQRSATIRHVTSRHVTSRWCHYVVFLFRACVTGESVSGKYRSVCRPAFSSKYRYRTSNLMDKPMIDWFLQ